MRSSHSKQAHIDTQHAKYRRSPRLGGATDSMTASMTGSSTYDTATGTTIATNGGSTACPYLVPSHVSSSLSTSARISIDSSASISTTMGTPRTMLPPPNRVTSMDIPCTTVVQETPTRHNIPNSSCKLLKRKMVTPSPGNRGSFEVHASALTSSPLGHTSFVNIQSRIPRKKHILESREDFVKPSSPLNQATISSGTLTNLQYRNKSMKKRRNSSNKRPLSVPNAVVTVLHSIPQIDIRHGSDSSNLRLTAVSGKENVPLVVSKLSDARDLQKRNKRARGKKSASSVATKNSSSNKSVKVPLGAIAKEFLKVLVSKSIHSDEVHLSDIYDGLSHLTAKRRIYDVVSVLDGSGILEKSSKNHIRLIKKPRKQEEHQQEKHQQEKLLKEEKILDMWIAQLQSKMSNNSMMYMAPCDLMRALSPHVAKESTCVAICAPQESLSLGFLKSEKHDIEKYCFSITPPPKETFMLEHEGDPQFRTFPFTPPPLLAKCSSTFTIDALEFTLPGTAPAPTLLTRDISSISATFSGWGTHPPSSPFPRDISINDCVPPPLYRRGSSTTSIDDLLNITGSVPLPPLYRRGSSTHYVDGLLNSTGGNLWDAVPPKPLSSRIGSIYGTMGDESTRTLTMPQSAQSPTGSTIPNVDEFRARSRSKRSLLEDDDSEENFWIYPIPTVPLQWQSPHPLSQDVKCASASLIRISPMKRVKNVIEV